ncbi:MAG: hypothetical protein PVI30_02340 [Myxococcales bacterium]|jgi:hypothetical protein
MSASVENSRSARAIVMARRVLVAVSLMMACGCGGAGPASTPDAEPGVRDFYPLVEGHAWAYDVDTGDGERVLAIIRVERVGEGFAAVRTGDGLRRYGLRADGIVREPEGVYLLRAPLRTGERWPSLGGSTATVAATGLVEHTPAGHFEGCLRVAETGGSRGGRIETTYCPGVGPVRVVSTLQLSRATVRVEATLRGHGSALAAE